MREVVFMRCIGKGSPAIYSGELARRLLKYPGINIRDINIPFKTYREIGSWIKYISNHRDKIYHFPFQHYAKFALFAETSVISVHDLEGFNYPFYPQMKEYLFRKADYIGIKRANHIITISSPSKKQIINYLNINPENISIIYNGVDDTLFRPLGGPSPFPFSYILFVGSEQPRKNFRTLVETFKILKEKKEFQNLKLVKVGLPEKQTYREQSLKKIQDLDLGCDVIFTGYVKEEDLPVYYSHASCFFSPAIVESFGLPTIEAMACGCPVITSNTWAFPEVVGDAGLMRDPFDTAGFAEDIEKLLNKDNLREELIKRGLERVKMFSWDKAAEKMREIYDFIE